MLIKLLKELTRRNVLRVAAIYIIVAWLISRFTEFAAPALGLPPAFGAFVDFLIFIGLPICAFLSWRYDYEEDGLVVTQPATAEELASSYALSRMDVILFGVMSLILAVIGLDTFFPAETVLTDRRDVVQNTQQTQRDISSVQKIEPSGSPSVAVLPFADESEAQDQEYFSDGVAEEILNALVTIRDLRVPGRTSSFAYKGTELSIKDIASQLRVEHILEGSVRKQADRLRVSVRLIQVADDAVIWSEAFNGSVSDIFDMQETIATQVASNLEVVLTGAQKAALAKRQTDNLEAHTAYLIGQKFLGARVGDNLPRAIESFEQSVSLDPEYAPAWAGLAAAHALMPQYRLVDFKETYTQAELNARRAIQIDPAMAEPYAVLGWIYLQRRDYANMKREFDKALSLDPNNITTNLWSGIGNVAVGKIAEADRRFSFVVERDPVALVGLHMQSLVSWMIGEKEEAQRRASRTFQLGYAPSGLQLGELAGEQGDLEASANYIALGMRGMATGFDEVERTIMGQGLFGDEALRTRAVQLTDEYAASDRPKTEIFIPYFLVRVGEVERGFRLYIENRAAFDPLIYYAIWGPHGEKARQHPAFAVFAEQLGLVSYWEQYGWPDVCDKPEETILSCGVL
ncbi:MAG: hypothetical protein MRY72_06960 [Aquisalinus sp.]|nr:hypothetical protein [Aquisalinus sp.]